MSNDMELNTGKESSAHTPGPWQEPRIRIGGMVTPSGAGRTRTWGKLTGTATRVTGRSVFVAWHNTCVEDQMARDEVRKFTTNAAPKRPAPAKIQRTAKAA